MAKKLSDLKPDPSNYNKHSEYGMSLLEKSMGKFGFVEAGLISEDNVICSGNARQEVAVSIGMDDLQIVDIDGTKPVYLRKKGLKSGTKEFKELGLALNAVPKANIVLDAEVIEAELGEAVCEEWGVSVGQNLGSAENPDAYGNVPTGDREPFQQMTFTLADEQHKTVKRAIEIAKGFGNFENTSNKNSNGNALARICETFITQNEHS